MMFRCINPITRIIRPAISTILNPVKKISCEIKQFSSLNQPVQVFHLSVTPKKSLAANKALLNISSKITPLPVRTVTKFSLKKGKRKTVKAVIKRFYRLDWGGWIRPKVGRNKKLWKKSSACKRRLRQHVFCNATQSTLLDKMVTKYWKRPKYYVDDPYQPYHTREEFAITRKKPLVRS